MNVIICDIWELQKSHKIVIPTNLAGPMGRGLAYQAKTRFPGLESWYKKSCKDKAIKPGEILIGKKLILFPVKYHWSDKADLGLIERSLQALSRIDSPVALPFIGCGFGERDWEREVRPLVERYLADKPNFVLVSMPPEIKAKYPKSFQPGARRCKTCPEPFARAQGKLRRRIARGI